MKAALALIPVLALSGCVAQTGVAYGTFELSPERPLSRCENYAQQTYFNTYNDLYSPEDGFGARSFQRANAQRAAERAYQRCLSGRLN